MDTPDQTYNDITAHLGTNPNSTWYAMSWYFSEHYPEVKQSDVMKAGWGLQSIIQDINNGWATVVEVYPPSGMGHALQVYGYETDLQGQVESLFYVNSWGYEELLEAPVVNGSWFYIPGTIQTIVGLIPEDMYVATPDPIIPDLPQPDVPSVPEPPLPALMLLGMAIAMIMRRNYAV